MQASNQASKHHRHHPSTHGPSLRPLHSHASSTMQLCQFECPDFGIRARVIEYRQVVWVWGLNAYTSRVGRNWAFSPLSPCTSAFLRLNESPLAGSAER